MNTFPLQVAALVGGVLVVGAGTNAVLQHRRRISRSLASEIWQRLASWAVIAALVLASVALGAAALTTGTALVALAGFREFARATGIATDRRMAWVTAGGLLTTVLASGGMLSLPPSGAATVALALVALAGVLRDAPAASVPRMTHAAVALLVFGLCLGQMAALAAQPVWGPAAVLWLAVGVAISDVSAFLFGRVLGRRKLSPVTSPGKTLEGAAGSLVTTTVAATALGAAALVAPGQLAFGPVLAGAFGVAVAAPLGDLFLSSFKRAAGLSDFGSALPGHGGILDRIDSLVFAAPVATLVLL